MKKSSRIALVIVSVAAGIIIGFCGFIYFTCKSIEKALKGFDVEEEFMNLEEDVEPEFVEVEGE